MLVLAAGLACLGLAVGCARDPAHPVAERVVMYICPQHPEVRAAQPGICPACGSELVREDEVSRPSMVAAGDPGTRR